MNPPKISVLIPTYNYARFLPEAIESVLGQEERDFEVLIIDDCSQDNTAEVVRPYCERDSRIQFSVNASNLGMVNNWNYCLEKARGHYVKFLFGDDRLCDRQALGKMAGLLERYPGAVLAASARVILDENSKVLDVWRPLADGCHNGKKIIEACLMEKGKNLVGEPSAVMFRKTDAQRGFDPQYRQVVDAEMWFHLLEKGDLAYTREPLCAFRCHPSQQTERNTEEGVAWKENARLIASHAVQTRFPRQVVFPVLYHLRHSKRADTAEMLEWQRQLVNRAGTAWRLNYWLYWLQYRITKPFHNVVHSLEKRAFRSSFKPS